MIADGQALSRREICEAALTSKRFGEKKMPNFEAGNPVFFSVFLVVCGNGWGRQVAGVY